VGLDFPATLSDVGWSVWERVVKRGKWNMRASAAVMVTTGMVEVIIRNSLDRTLVGWAGGRGDRSWLESVPLDSRGKTDIVKARARASRDDRDLVVHGKVVAELRFGFWRYLVASRYHASLWDAACAVGIAHVALIWPPRNGV
jgi:hypothetical protein